MFLSLPYAAGPTILRLYRLPQGGPESEQGTHNLVQIGNVPLAVQLISSQINLGQEVVKQKTPALFACDRF